MWTAAMAMLHASHLPPGSPWLAVAVIDLDRVKKLAERMPQEAVDMLAERIGRMREAFRRQAGGSLVWETVRMGLTLAAKTAAAPKEAYVMALNSIGDASLGVKQLADAHEQAVNAARETKRQLEEAKEAFREAKRVLETAKVPYKAAMAARREELARSRTELRNARKEAEEAEADFAETLGRCCAGELHQELIEAVARRLNVSARYLRALLGEPHGDLTAEERQKIIDRALSGTPVTILAAEYHVTRQHIYRLLHEETRQVSPVMR